MNVLLNNNEWQSMPRSMLRAAGPRGIHRSSSAAY